VSPIGQAKRCLSEITIGLALRCLGYAMELLPERAALSIRCLHVSSRESVSPQTRGALSHMTRSALKPRVRSAPMGAASMSTVRKRPAIPS
jgi:hypothetical protein